MFKYYHGNLHDIPKRHRTSKTITRILKMMAKTPQNQLQQHDVDVTVKTSIIEMSHYGLEHRVFYIPHGLCQLLMNTSLDIPCSYLRERAMPFGTFEICVEQDSIDELGVAPCLVSFPVEAELETMNAICNDILDQAMSDARGMCMLFTHGNFISFQGVRLEYGTVENSLQNDLMKNIMVSPHQMGTLVQLTQKREKLSRLALATLLYLGLQDGEQEPIRDFNRPQGMDVPPQIVCLGRSIERLRPGWHIRKGHMRYFKHPRYKVAHTWVRPCQINPELDMAFPCPKDETHAISQ